jgi:hypothetical protein
MSVPTADEAKCGIAVSIEVGVRLVEHDQERIAIKRTGERDKLPLAGRQCGITLADLVALWMPQD